MGTGYDVYPTSLGGSGGLTNVAYHCTDVLCSGPFFCKSWGWGIFPVDCTARESLTFAEFENSIIIYKNKFAPLEIINM